MGETLDAFEDVLTALCVWREAQDQPLEAKRAVLHIILNRTRDAKGRWPRLRSEVVLQRAQFSSFSPGDVNATKMPHWNDPSWQECCRLVDNPGDDPTGGGNHYYSPDSMVPKGSKPKWAEFQRIVAEIGAFKFFRL